MNYRDAQKIWRKINRINSERSTLLPVRLVNKYDSFLLTNNDNPEPWTQTHDIHFNSKSESVLSYISSFDSFLEIAQVDYPNNLMRDVIVPFWALKLVKPKHD